MSALERLVEILVEKGVLTKGEADVVLDIEYNDHIEQMGDDR